MFFKKIIVLLLVHAVLGAALAQQDSLLLHPETLAEKDIYAPLEKADRNIKIISGSRFPIAAADLPFSSHIITKEEIRRNGYETLVDALKMVPGVRVSQPGSPTEGETFLMRGLLGNTYAKILINDVPVKPAFVASMPIGAQLPIKEAERIEIIYGAGAALYGSDASAGVINIITRESDKPVFMQADLSVGGGIYSSVNVMFGGRLGRDKRIFKYFAYASNVVFENRNIFYDQDYNYRPSTYTADTTALKGFPNFGFSVSADNPILTNTPHLSRKFGFNIKYKRLTLSAETMYRRDHSSLGHNPVAYSYRNPQTFTGEAILKFNLNIYKESEKKNRKTDLTYIRYNLDSRSSVLAVQNRLALMLVESAKAQAKVDNSSTAQAFFEKTYKRYLDGLRYQFGQSDEWRVEHVRNYRLFKFVTLTAGANLKIAIGNPFTNYLSRPVTESQDNFLGFDNGFLFDSTTFSIAAKEKELLEANGFGQLFYNGKKFNLAAGASYATYLLEIEGGDGSISDFDNLSPRLSGLWKITKNINLRSTWGTAFRAPNPYYQSTSYAIVSNNKPIVTRPDLPIFPEKTTSWESGIRWKTDEGAVGADLTWFLNKTTRLLKYGRREELFASDSIYFGLLGYTNLENSAVRYTGGQFSIFFNSEVNGKQLVDALVSYSWLNYKEKDLTTLEGIDIRPPSGGIWQLRNSFSPFKKSRVIVDLIRYRDMARTGGSKPKNKLWTWDLVWRYSFTDRFDGYVKIINLFNKEYSGILPDGDATDLLHYNPQSGFFLRLGMNYYIE